MPDSLKFPAKLRLFIELCFIPLIKKKGHRPKPAMSPLIVLVFVCSGDLPMTKVYYFTLSTMALKASLLFMARLASVLRLISMPALWRAPINCE